MPATVGSIGTVKLTVVGCSPAWPNPGGAHSGYLLEHGGRRLLVDCGPGVLSRLRAAEGWPEIDAIVISHFHLDHCGDLVAWLWGTLHGPHDAPQLWVTPGGRGELDNLSQQIADAFDVHEYVDGERFDAAGFAITPFRVPHYTQPTWALRIEADGKVVAYSADTGPSPILAEIARDADLFMCEATLAEDDHDREPRGHLKASEAAAAALNANAKRLLLVHRPVEAVTSDGLELARDGLEIDL
ncbi:MAG TPA: MBL fold metallo-hydrolase [Gaiellaceae bacterium]